jgi:hypothetical protein
LSVLAFLLRSLEVVVGRGQLLLQLANLALEGELLALVELDDLLYR